MPLTSTSILAELGKLKHEIGRSSGLELLGIVGSFSTDQQSANSDIDIVFEPIEGKPISFFDISRAAFKLEDVLGRPVDLIDWGGLSDDVRSVLKSELKPIA